MRILSPCPKTGDVSRAKQLSGLDVTLNRPYSARQSESLIALMPHFAGLHASMEDDQWPSVNG